MDKSKKNVLMVAALAVTLVGGGLAGAALLPSANAASSTAKPAQPSATGGNIAATGGQGQADTDKEVADDQQVQGDTDKEVADDQQVQADTDKEVADDNVNAAAITKEQSIELAKKQVPGTVQSVKTESENGKPVFNIVIKDSAGKEHEINIDASAGTVIPEND